MYKKFIIKSTIFILIFCITTPVLGRFLSNGKNITLDGFYYEEQNNLDVLFFGSSQMYCTVVPNIIWEKTGVPTYNLAQPEQPLWLTYHYIKEALEYQKPKVVFMDVLTVTIEEEYMPTANSNINLDSLKMSKNKLEAINASVPKEERPYFLFKLLQHKVNWKNISQSNFVNNFINERNPNKGFLEMYQTVPYDTPAGFNTEEIGEIPDKAEEYLYKIIELFEDKDIDLVFIKAPYVLTEEHQKKFNRVAQIAKENDIEYIDFNQMYDELEIDFSLDMLDSYHLNLIGARKVSEYIASYIDTNYDLSNKKNDPEYGQWNTDASIWDRKEKAYRLSQQNDMESYFEFLEQNNQDYIITTTYNDDNKHYLKINDGDKTIEEKQGDSAIATNINLDEVNFDISFINGNCSLKVNSEEHAKNNKGLNVAVYDKTLNSVVDKINIDFSKELKIVR